MSSPSSSPAPRSSRASTGARTTPRKKAAIGAVVGAVIGGVLGAVLVKKARHVNPKKLIPAKLPALGRRALDVVKNVADDAKTIAQVAAAKAADQAVAEAKGAAQRFVVEVASRTTGSTARTQAQSGNAARQGPVTAAKKPSTNRRAHTRKQPARNPRGNAAKARPSKSAKSKA